MRAHNRNAAFVARHLESHPETGEVVHPSLSSHPDAALARRLLDGGSGLVLLHLVGGDERARGVLAALRLIRPAPTLGGLESLAFLPGDAAAGAVRLSVGVEDPADIVADLDQALACEPARPAVTGVGAAL
jgi:cystathionine beta-lyase/cystathionine gamma-synthase